MSEEDKQDKGFRVSDRRRFSVSQSGEAREEGEAAGEDKKPLEHEEAPREKTEAAGKEETEPGGKQGADKPQEPAALPEINFSTFVVSLSSSALIHLGIVPDPMTGEKKKELAIAKQTIDMLGMLQEKTRGNLDPGEKNQLNEFLQSLRLNYARVAREEEEEGKKIKKPPSIIT